MATSTWNGHAFPRKLSAININTSSTSLGIPLQNIPQSLPAHILESLFKAYHSELPSINYKAPHTTSFKMPFKDRLKSAGRKIRNVFRRRPAAANNSAATPAEHPYQPINPNDGGAADPSQQPSWFSRLRSRRLSCISIVLIDCDC